MRLPGLKTAARLGLWARSRLTRGGLILGYHRVSDSVTDPYGICIRTRHFEQHLALLRETCNPMRLTELVRRATANDLPPRAVALTLDDGYVDNLVHAAPLLERYEIPPTVFVVTGHPGEEFAWDAFARLAWSADVNCKELDVLLRGGTARTEASRSPHADETARRRAQIERGFLEFRRLDVSRRSAVLAELSRRRGPVETPSDFGRAMTVNELRELEAGGHIEIGAHTVTHPRLADLAEDSQREEIVRSKKDLEAILGRRVEAFAYPHGSLGERSAALVREAGFDVACTSGIGTVRRRSDPFRLPRLWARDRNRTEFARWLGRWQ